MARRFERTRRGVTARLDEDERALLTDLLTEVSALLDDAHDPDEDPLDALVGISQNAHRPDDPALARLLPDAAGDDEQASEFRRFTERGLRERKRSALLAARESLTHPGPLILDDASAHAWLTALNDVRLVVAERLGLRTDADAELLAAVPPAESDPRAWLAAVYDFLTWLQETLVSALSDQLRRGGPAAGGSPGGPFP